MKIIGYEYPTLKFLARIHFFIQVNGINVIEAQHNEVIDMIKQGLYVTLTLQQAKVVKQQYR